MNIRQYRIEFIDKCFHFSDRNLKNCIPESVCPLLLHTVVPYYITYKHNGNFSWVKEPGHVDVQCPNPYGHVITDVINGDNIFFIVKSSENFCPIKYKIGMEQNISKIFELICPSVYDVAFPWIQLGIDDYIELRCPGCEGKTGIRFVLRKVCENK